MWLRVLREKLDVSASSTLQPSPKHDSEANFEATSSLAAEMPSTKSKGALIPRISTTTAANAMQVVRT